MTSLTIHAVENGVASVPDSLQLMLVQAIPAPAGTHLARMFRDPYVLEKDERVELIQQLREAVALEPALPELRVLLGMALCVNLDVQDALEELREAAKIAPNSFLARLKFGELLMRLRICSQAAEETQTAAKLAANPIQSELARKQAAAIRAMQREGVERGGYGKLLAGFHRISRWFTRADENPVPVALNSR
jgi:tetratricopeptide (TPR) repeat protein